MATASNQGSTGLDWLDQWLGQNVGGQTPTAPPQQNQVAANPNNMGAMLANFLAQRGGAAMQGAWQGATGQSPAMASQAQDPMAQVNQAIAQQLNPIQLDSLEKAYRKQTDTHAQEFMQSHGPDAAAQILAVHNRMPTDETNQQTQEQSTNQSQGQGENIGLPPGTIKQPTNAFQRGGWMQGANGNVAWQQPGWFAQYMLGYPNEVAAGMAGEGQKLAGQVPLQKGQREAAISQALFELPNQFIEQEKAAAQAVPQLRSMMTAGEKAGTLLGIQPESLKLQKRIIQGSAQGSGAALINKLMRIKELQGMQGNQQTQHTPQQVTVYNKARASGLSIEEAKKKAGF